MLAQAEAEAEVSGYLEQPVLPPPELEMAVGDYLKIFEANGSGFFLKSQAMCYYGVYVAETMGKDKRSYDKKILIFERYFETIVIDKMGDDQPNF